MITLAGGQDVGASGPTSSWQMSTEDIVKADPQIIILDDYQYGVTVESVEQRPGRSTITAVKNGAIYPITDLDLDISTWATRYTRSSNTSPGYSSRII